MSSRNPWTLLAAAWVPAVLFLVLNLAAVIWLKGNTVGREALLATEVDRLETEIAGLESTGAEAQDLQQQVTEVASELTSLDREVFGDLTRRLPAILRAVGNACAAAGLRPDRYAYSASEQKDSELIRFTISFNVEGTYEQLRRLLAELQGSDQLLSVTRLGFNGSDVYDGPELSLRLGVETHFNQADPEALKRLLDGEAEALAAASAEPEGDATQEADHG